MRFADLPDAFLQTIIHHIAALLLRGAGGDMQRAQQAALLILGARDPRTEAEFSLVARILGFNLQALDALAQAADPDMPLTRMLRLRSGAVSLAREAQKAERQLARLQADRSQTVEPEPPPKSPPPEPQAESPPLGTATAPISDNRKIAGYAKAHGLTFSQALQKRQRDMRLAERERKAQAQAKAQPRPAPSGPASGSPPGLAPAFA